MPTIADETTTIEVVPHLTCYLCGGEGKVVCTEMRDRLYFAPGRWSIRECMNPTCRLAWSDPQPVEKDLYKLYLTYYTHDGSGEHIRGDRWSRWCRAFGHGVVNASLGYQYESAGRLDTVAQLAGRLAGLLPQVRDLYSANLYWVPRRTGGVMLDIGCGSGEAMLRFKASGWQVRGVEPDAVAAATAREKRGLDVQTGTLERAHFEDKTFDFVTMHHVLEHLPDVTRTLKQVYRVLKPGGRLILATPNTQSRGRRKFGPTWIGWESPRHLSLFSKRNLPHALELAGLRMIKQWTCARQAGWMLAISDTIRKHGIAPDLKLPWPPPLSQRIRRAWYQYTEAALCPMASWGEELVAIVERPA